jgi:hypothetical protein
MVKPGPFMKIRFAVSKKSVGTFQFSTTFVIFSHTNGPLFPIFYASIGHTTKTDALIRELLCYLVIRDIILKMSVIALYYSA